MAEKHIFIGLGGSGVETVSLIKYKIYERTKGTEMKSRLQVMNENYRFLFIDTDSRDVKAANARYRNVYEGGKMDFISDVDLLNLGDINPYIAYNEAKLHPELRINRRILEACPQMVAESMDNRDLSFGAGALRLKSRIAFGRKESDFVNKLQTCINELNQEEIDSQKNVIHYWVVASCNGGTGSGTVQDVLYLVNMTHRTQVDKGNPKVGLVLYMPRIYMNLNPDNEKYPRNAYAVFKELEAFQKWAKEGTKNLYFHRMAMLDDYTLFDEEMPYRPFEFCIPIDYHTERNSNMGSLEKMYSNTAELMYYIHSGQGASGFKSFLDNYEDGEVTTEAGCFLIPMGYMALRKPDQQFENYVTLRGRYEMLRYGILGNPVESADERRKLMLALFNSVIKNTLFKTGTGKTESYFRTITEMVTEMTEEDMPDNLIRDSDNKIASKLPTNVSIEEARSVIASIETAIRRHSEDKNRTRKAIEQALWTWTEDSCRNHGLQYTKDILQELDAYCNDLYMAYTTDLNTAILEGLHSSQRALVENRDSIEGELDDLYQRAVQVSLKERITGGNANDVSVFFNRLKDWVQASVSVMLAEEAFEMMRDLAYGDRGIIDRIITHLRRLTAEASSLLNGDNGAAHAYTSLAKSFFNAKLDVTSVYVPDITEYVDGYGWREDGNLFSQWYGLVVAHTTEFIPGEGYTPLRNGDPSVSLAGIFSQMISLYGDQMIQEKYIVDNQSHLFTNTSKSDFRRVVEDLLDYTAGTLHSQLHQNNTVATQWYEKTLAKFFAELNNEARHTIQKKTQPALFFPYMRAMRAGRLVDRAFCVGPKGVVNDVFLEASSAGITKPYDSDDPSVMYKIVTKLGLSFEYYDLYQSVKNEYDACMNKVFYHFHQAFAAAGGDAERIVLPREIKPELIVFTKYLLLNQLRTVFTHLMRHGTETYNADHYADTPVIFDGSIAKFATSAALELVNGEQLELRVTDGVNSFYHTVVVDHPEHRMTELLAGFTQQFNVGRYASLAGELVKDLNYLESDLLRQRYQEALAALKNDLNTQWQAAGKKERETIGDILRVASERLDTVAKFLSNKYQG